MQNEKVEFMKLASRSAFCNLHFAFYIVCLPAAGRPVEQLVF
jgi:hypothetical protein